MSHPASVLVVDDSATMRAMISAVLARDPAITVVGQAADALEARSAIKTLNPDVVTLDVEMPNMNGLEFLEKIMLLRPMPVIMVSSLTQRGAEVTLAALEIGAFDCVGKPVAGEREPFADLPSMVKAAAASKRHAPCSRTTASVAAVGKPETAADYRPSRKIIAIGASTGGVEALIQIVSRLPANCPPTVITQHMPGAFTRSFAERLNRHCAPEVAEAEDGESLQFGRIYLAPGGNRHLRITNAGAPCCQLSEGPAINGHCPSVDALFTSVAETAGKHAVGVILTGMGRDGADGLLKMRKAGASTLGQDERTSVVYGMPRVAFEMGAVSTQLPLGSIGHELVSLTSARTVGTA